MVFGRLTVSTGISNRSLMTTEAATPPKAAGR